MLLATATQSSQRRRGAAAVELAAVAPLLALMLVGTIEIARALMVKEALTDASRQACRAAILPGRTDQQVRDEITLLLSRNFGATVAAERPADRIRVNGVVSTPANDLLKNAKRGDRIEVQSQVRVAQVGWVYGWFMRGTTVMAESVSMMRQG